MFIGRCIRSLPALPHVRQGASVWVKRRGFVGVRPVQTEKGEYTLRRRGLLVCVRSGKGVSNYMHMCLCERACVYACERISELGMRGLAPFPGRH